MANLVVVSPERLLHKKKLTHRDFLSYDCAEKATFYKEVLPCTNVGSDLAAGITGGRN